MWENVGLNDYLFNYLFIFNGKSSMRNEATELGLNSICLKYIQKSDIYFSICWQSIANQHSSSLAHSGQRYLSTAKKKSSRGGPLALLKKKINVSVQQRVLEFELP